jgi:hypothetical protein
MFKYSYKSYKKKLKSRLLLGFLAGTGLILLFVLFMVTPVGNVVLKKLIEIKIDRYIPGAKITYLDCGVDNFSMIAVKGHNTVKLYGALFPFNAMFEGNVENLGEFFPELRGKMNLSGKMYRNKKGFVIDGMSFFANGYMNFKVTVDDKTDFEADGSGFELKKILYMFKVNYPWVKGQTDIRISGHNSVYKFLFNTSGEYDRRIKTDFKAVTDVTVKNGTEEFSSKIKSGIGKISLNGNVSKGSWKFKFKVSDLDLSRLQPVLLYPFKEKTDMCGVYDSSEGMLKFRGNDFEGIAYPGIELTFNMNDGQFFEYIGLRQILEGNMSGTVKIYNNSGTFDIVGNNTRFIKTGLIKKIYSLTGVDLSKENTGKVFLKGMFDKNQTVFDMLSNNQNISISIKNGKFVYPNRCHIIVYLRKNGSMFKLLLDKDRVKILKKRNLKETDNKILVF